MSQENITPLTLIATRVDQREGLEEALDGQGSENLPVLTALQERAMAALLVEPTVPAAARAAKVGLRTIRAWLAHDDNFAAQYRNARREIFANTVQSLQERAPTVANELYQIATNKVEPASARVAAARALLEFTFRGTEVLHVTEQIETTQEALAEAKRRQNNGGRQ